jgi:hypothetical protein
MSMTEDFTRMAAAMAAGHRQRGASNMRRRREADERHVEVAAQFAETRAMRAAAGREQRTAAAAERALRRHGVAAFMAQCHDALEARRRVRREIVRTARAQAMAFMQALTDGVVAMRDGFSASQKSRAMSWRGACQSLHHQLAGLAGDRHGARTAFHAGRRAGPA